jgi:uncharacterized protein (TIGR03118 family)
LNVLDSPWGMAVAPEAFGNFGGDLLVGNFGDSHVNVFNLQTGGFLGQLDAPNGQPLVLNGGFNGPDTKGLWGIRFGAGTGVLYFASGINDESDGLFGSVTPASQGGNQNNDQGWMLQEITANHQHHQGQEEDT